MGTVFLAVVLSLVLPQSVSSTTRIPFSIQSSADNVLRRMQSSTAFQHHSINNRLLIARQSQSVSSTNKKHRIHHRNTALLNNNNMNDDTSSSSSFLSTSKANVSFDNKGRSSDSTSPSNLSTIDQLLLTLTSDRTSLLLGSIGILFILLLRLISFPEDATYEASRSRIDLLGVFAAGSVLLNGITKLDVESVQAERVMLEGINQDKVIWNENQNSSTMQGRNDKFQSTVEWALSSFLKCTPAQSAVLLTTQQNSEWIPLATVGILPQEEQLRSSISSDLKTPILDRMLREDGSIKGGTVGGAQVVGSTRRKGANESYLPTLQALPGQVEFTYLPSNAQEALLLPVTRPDDMSDNNDDGWYYAVVLGGDKAKSFAPRDIAWCKEIASLVGDVL